MLTINVISQFDTLQFSSSKINSKILSADDKTSNKTFLNYASVGIFSGVVLPETIENNFVVLLERGLALVQWLTTGLPCLVLTIGLKNSGFLLELHVFHFRKLG